ncbi:MAG: hypothetical protein BWY78_00604 [Alphaproteobacteria bacterium ADurb.Bin438]|nr:MAG: hypothetical protein BWY78_00604 [Alphaproteobacteria bacterium ADurb.Bin438]
MKKLLFLFALLLSFDLKAEEVAKKPEWIEFPLKGCMQNEICVISSGKSVNEATLKAQIEVMKVFNTMITSNYESLTSNDNDKVSDSALESSKSITEGVLSGVKIKKTFKDGDEVYVQASLNKDEAKQNILTEIQAIDEKMQVLLRDEAVSSNSMLRKLYETRSELNKKYAFLNQGKGYDEVVKYEDVFKQKKKNASGKVVAIKIVEPKGKRLENSFKKLLTENGLKVSSSSYNLELKGELYVEPEYMNVEGFVKFLYIFNLVSLDLNGEALGSVNVEFSETGRSESQAMNKALKRIAEEVKENFADLGL